MRNNMKEIKLTQGKVALVDDEDFEKVSQYKWAARGNGHGKIYASRTDNKNKTIRLHRFLLSVIDTKIQVDHINGDPLDNQRKNLRICNSAQNARNRKKILGRSSIYKGVTLTNNKYLAQICKDYKYVYIGYFNSPIEAALAYNKKALELFGEFAYLNKIEGI